MPPLAISLLSTLTSPITLTLLILTIFILHRIYTHPIHKIRRLSGKNLLTQYSLPFGTHFYNDAHFLISNYALITKRPLTQCLHFLLSTPVLIISDPETIRLTCIKLNLKKHHKLNEINAKLTGKRGLLVAEGPQWKRMRALFAPLFTVMRREYYQMILEQINVEIVSIRRAIQESPTKSTTLDLYDLVSRITLHIVSFFVFGRDCEEMVEGGQIWRQLSEDFMDYFGGYFKYGMAYEWLAPSSWRLHRGTRRMRQIIEHYVEQNRAELERPQAFPNIVAECIQHALQHDGKIDYNMIQDQAQTFLFAGNETTSALVTSTFFELAKDPVPIKKAQEEADQFDEEYILSQAGNPQFSMAKTFDFIDRCLLETLRHYPPAYAVDREVQKDMYLGEGDDRIFLPKGTMLDINIYGVHHNADVWEHPYEWMPDRWLDPELPRRTRHAFIPFSLGTRDCVGKPLAMLQSQLIVIQLLRQFNMRFPETYFWKSVRLDPGFILKPEEVLIEFSERDDVVR